MKASARARKIGDRIGRMRALIGMGLTDAEVRDKLAAEAGGKLTDRQWHYLRASLMEDSKGESNLVFWSRFRERHSLRYRECVRLLAYAHGIDNPHRKVDREGRFVDPSDQFLVPPNVAACVQVLRLMKDLDECKLEVGLRLSVFNREPQRLLVGRSPDELDDGELATLLDETIRRAAASLGCSEHEVLRLVEGDGAGKGGAGSGVSEPPIDVEVVEVQPPGISGVHEDEA